MLCCQSSPGLADGATSVPCAAASSGDRAERAAGLGLRRQERGFSGSRGTERCSWRFPSPLRDLGDSRHLWDSLSWLAAGLGRAVPDTRRGARSAGTGERWERGTRARPLLRTPTPDAVNEHRKRHFLRQLNKPVLYARRCSAARCWAVQPCQEHSQPAAVKGAALVPRGAARPSRVRVGMAPAVCTARRVQLLTARIRALFSPCCLIRTINIL